MIHSHHHYHHSLSNITDLYFGIHDNRTIVINYYEPMVIINYHDNYGHYFSNITGIHY